jgi:hypothetical protein
MGYYVKSKKINIVLAEKQQQAVLNMWMNPPSDVQENNFAMRLLPPYFKDQNLTTLKEILDMVGITYEDTKKGLKLKSHEGKLRHQRDLFDWYRAYSYSWRFFNFTRGRWCLNGLLFHWREVN